MSDEYLSNDEEQKLLEQINQAGRKAIEAGCDLEDVVWKSKHIQNYAYRRHIADMCGYLAEAVLEEGGSVDGELFDEILDEQVDSDRWVFMTGLAEVVGTVSDNADAAETQFGSESAYKPGVVAYNAIRADIRDRLRARMNIIKDRGLPMGDQERELIQEHGQWIVIDKDGEEVTI